MKRFWKQVTVEAVGAGWEVRLDGRPVKTPGRAPLAFPSRALADAVAEEWGRQGEKVDIRSMPLTGLANAAIDRVAPDMARFVADLAVYGETDLLCYRADSPPPLVARQGERWDPLLAWARSRYDVHFAVATGIMHCAQPPETIARLGEAVAACDAFELAALSPLVTISGSLVVSLALLEGAIDSEAAFDLTHLEELWQVEHWGEDSLATAARALRRQDFLAAVRFLQLLA